jgi:AraC-like DNA-binding protein
MTLSHVAYLPGVFLTSDDDILLCNLIGTLLDCMIVCPLVIVLLLSMLQDRRRPLWPIAVMFAPIAVGNAFNFITRSYAFLPIAYIYFLLMCMGLIIYMVREVRRYGRWLRDNYADLEHKEVWQSFLVLAIIIMLFGIYASGVGGLAYEYAVQTLDIVLVFYLLWRVETLSDLSIPQPLPFSAEEGTITTETTDDEDEHQSSDAQSQTIRDSIGPKLKRRCEDRQLYLQHDISISQLARQIGVNRSYLSNHFALKSITYNAYINGLRIQHFVKLYHEAVANHQPVTAQQLAHQSGFRSYSTFSAAFKQIMGMTATEWMRNIEEQE